MSKGFEVGHVTIKSKSDRSSDFFYLANLYNEPPIAVTVNVQLFSNTMFKMVASYPINQGSFRVGYYFDFPRLELAILLQMQKYQLPKKLLVNSCGSSLKDNKLKS